MHQVNAHIWYVVFGLFCWFWNQQSIAQHNQKLDSLLNVYQHQPDSENKIGTVSHLFNAMIYTNPEEAFDYAIEEIQLSEKFEKPRGYGMGHYHLSTYYAIKNNSDSVIYHLQKALEAFKKAGSEDSQALVLSSLAFNQYDQGNLYKAISLTDSAIAVFDRMNEEYKAAVMHGLKAEILSDQGKYLLAYKEARESYQVIDTLNKPIRRAEALNRLANIETRLGNYHSAQEHHLITVPIYKKYLDSLTLPVVYNNIGENYHRLQKSDSAKWYFTKAHALATKFERAREVGNALLNLAIIHKEDNEPDSALIKLNEALTIFRNINYKKEIALVNSRIGQVYLQLEEHDNALKALNQCVAKFETIGAINELKEALKIRSALYEKQGLISNALEDYQRFHSLSDSVYNIEKSRQIEDLRALYLTEKKEQEILRQANEIRLLSQKAKINQLKASLSITGLVLALFLIGGTILFYRQRVKQNKLENEKVTAELEFKRKELTANALHLAGKNRLLETLMEQVKTMQEKQNGTSGFNELLHTIKFNLQDENNWNNFKMYFEAVHKDFNTKIKEKYPNLTANELRLIALLKMNLSSKEIANILNVSGEGVKKARYRLRKKMEITSDDSLQDQILSM